MSFCTYWSNNKMCAGYATCTNPKKVKMNVAIFNRLQGCVVSETKKVEAACLCKKGAEAKGVLDCKKGRYCWGGPQQCRNGAKPVPPTSGPLIDCPVSGYAPVKRWCKCAADSKLNECNKGKFCFGGACNAARKAKCKVSETEPVKVTDCQCAPTSQSNECKFGNYCYGSKCNYAAKAPSPAPDAKAKARVRAQLSEASRRLMLSCRTTPRFAHDDGMAPVCKLPCACP